MKRQNFGIFNDSLLNCKYEFVQFDSAKELSENLKSTLSNIGIDFNEFNSANSQPTYSWAKKDSSIDTPPTEIYEYQNFFLLEKENGDFYLLDGFRRLLWYNTPNVPVYARIYKEKDLNPGQILSLLVYLNNWKFFGSSQYYDRGFALLLYTVFGLKIQNYKEAFDAYLSSSKIKNDYSSGGSTGNEKNSTIKERILNPHFISDIKFIQELNENENCMINSFFGALVFKERQESDNDFNSNEFVKLQNENSVLKTLLTKFEKTGTNRGARSQDVVNQIQEMYANLFLLMKGGTIEKSYAEKVQECKDLSASIKKDKNWTKLTAIKSPYIIERLMNSKMEAGEVLKFKCIIFPTENESYYRKKEKVLDYGLFEGVKYLGLTSGKKSWSNQEMQFGFKIDDDKFTIAHNYGDWNSYGNKYTKIYSPSLGGPSYEIDLFVNIPQAELKEAKVK